MMSMKLISEQLMLGCPWAANLGKLDLFIPGELPRQRLTFSRRIVVFASPNNPGALRVAKDLALATGDCIEVTSDRTNSTITHFLLYLNDKTYSHSAGKELAEELRRAGAVQGSSGSTIEIVTVHENDPERGGCEFGIFFDGRTPKDLVDGGIYNVRALLTVHCALAHVASRPPHLAPDHTCTCVLLASQAIAQALYSGRFWPVSAALVAKAMGATTVTGSRPHSFTTASALRVELRNSALRPAIRRVVRERRDAAETRRLRRASHLYGWYNDGAQATRDRPGREFLRGPGARRNTPARIEPVQSERTATGSSETSRSDPGPSAGVQTAHGPQPRLADGTMQRQPVQGRVGHPAALPSPRLPPEVRV